VCTGSGWCSPVHSPRRRTRWACERHRRALGRLTSRSWHHPAVYGDIPHEVAIALADGVDGIDRQLKGGENVLKDNLPR
jgi:hypothetical protein